MLPQLHTPVPGPKSLALAARLQRVESRNVTFLHPEFPVFWERGAGTNVWDVDGNRFLDLTSAFGVTGLGHCAPALVDAVHGQADTLLHAMGDVHPTELKVRLCEQLSALTFERWGVGNGKTILGNSGFEAVEAALKTSLLLKKKRGVIAFEGGYHGLGYGALAANGMPFFADPFRQQLADFAEFVPFPNAQNVDSSAALEALERQLSALPGLKNAGCILVEPIQGRGGDIVPPDGFLPLLRRFCDAHGLLLVLDEIYTGFNRTGRLFACEHSGVVPDLICLGKALTGGLPLSACVGRAEVMDAWPESDGEALHTSTFLGNPVACRMALASLEIHAQPATAEGVRRAGETFRKALEAVRSPRAGRVRGRGLLLGMELAGPPGICGEVMKAALRDGLLLLGGGPAGNVLSFTPPFGISDEEIAFSADWLQEYFTSLPGSIS